jgi:hypothetical protein
MTATETTDDGLRALCELPREGEPYFLLGVPQGTALRRSAIGRALGLI